MEIGIILTIIFVVLRLTGVIHWSWWWVFSPLWIGGIITGIMFATFGAISAAGIIKRGGRTSVGGVFAIIAGLSSLFDGIMVLLSDYSFWLAILPFILGIIALIGGGFTLKRRHWGWALAGAICSLSSGGFELDATIFGIPYRPILLVFAILAIIFISMGKREFTSRQVPFHVELND